LGSFETASPLLSKTIELAKSSEQLNMVTNGLVSLAKIALVTDDLKTAENRLLEAVGIVEHLRAPIPAEEFRMSVLADKRSPFEMLSRLYVMQGRIELAFAYAEQARSRTLFEKLGQSRLLPETSSGIEYENLRERLNWYYSRLARDAGDDVKLRTEITKIEKQLSEIALRDSSVIEHEGVLAESVDWAALPKRVSDQLGSNHLLIEYVLCEGSISAFVVTGAGFQYFENITTETRIRSLLEALRFQYEAMRFSSIGSHEIQLKERTDKVLEALYDELFLPFDELVDGSDLVIVPVGQLFYVPFNALYDGDQYQIQKGTVTLSPSAAIWCSRDVFKSADLSDALVLAFADDNSPLISREAKSVASTLGTNRVYSSDKATLAAYFSNSETASVIHLACHGEFRADSPLYSNLRFADGFLTVRDIAGQHLRASLVTLSACETGLNKVYAGEEILGLARGFLGAGAKNIVMSLWTVNDESTNRLMDHFYHTLTSGDSASESLRSAQVQLIQNETHPYFWASFAIIGK
jgi:hypothetical protein